MAAAHHEPGAAGAAQADAFMGFQPMKDPGSNLGRQERSKGLAAVIAVLARLKVWRHPPTRAHLLQTSGPAARHTVVVDTQPARCVQPKHPCTSSQILLSSIILRIGLDGYKE